MNIAEELKKQGSGSKRWVRVTFTPETARAALDTMIADNRVLRISKIAKYAADMSADRWDEDFPVPITFDKEDRLIGGQHRLWAVIRANKPITFWVCFGVDVTTMAHDESWSTSDRLIRELNLKGFDFNKTHSKMLGAITKFLSYVVIGDGRSLSTHEQIQIVRTFRKQITRVLKLTFPKGFRGSTTLSAAHVVMLCRDEEKAEGFTSRVLDGVNLSSGSPALLLRNHLYGVAPRYNRIDTLGRCLLAGRSYFLGKKMTRLVVPKSGWRPLYEFFIRDLDDVYDDMDITSPPYGGVQGKKIKEDLGLT